VITVLPSLAAYEPWASVISLLPQASPCQNASAERLIGSILRECVDHMVVVFAENRVRLEYLGIADRKGLALANSQRPPGSYAERPWDELPECSGSIHHLRN
jgi:hypothetical protein